MKRVALLLVLALPAAAQLTRQELVVSRLTSDLIDRDSGRFTMDLNRSFPHGVAVDRQLGRALNALLAGRSLSEDNVIPLVNGILYGLDGAFLWRGEESPVIESDRFRDAVKQIYFPLTRLGVSAADAQDFLRLYYWAAGRLAHPVNRVTPK